MKKEKETKAEIENELEESTLQEDSKELKKEKKPRLIERLRERARVMLSLDCTPRELALASGLGMLVGMSPYVGLQTYIAIGLSTFFRVPIYPLIIGVYITNPITIPFIFTLTTKFGMWLLNMHISVDIQWSTLTIKGLLEAGKSLFIPFIVGTHVIGVILSIPTYFIVLFLAKKYKKPKTVVPCEGEKAGENEKSAEKQAD